MTQASELIRYFESLGITVNTNTKARGHYGFCMQNRIDISKHVKPERFVQTLFHEFAHYLHSKFENNIEKTGGTLYAIFEEDSIKIFEELLAVTNWIDEGSMHKRLSKHKELVQTKIKELDSVIKKEYPNFQRSKKFKEFDKVIKKSKVKYLLKYDRVRVCGWFFQKDKVFSIDNIEEDFPELKPTLVAYIRLKSYQKKQKRISARINKLKKYYERPTELFARFVEGIYKDKNQTQMLAPYTFEKFSDLIEQDRFSKIKIALEIMNECNNGKIEA